MNEVQKQKAIFEKDLADCGCLRALQQQEEWKVIIDVLNSLTTQYANNILSGKEVIDDPDKVRYYRGCIDGVRAISDRFNTILKKGKEAEASLDQMKRDGVK